jgi:hypothetical protein
MSLSIAAPDHTTPVTNSVIPTVWYFFRPCYTFSSLPPSSRGSGELNVYFYLAHYGDLQAAFGTNYSALDHWINYGIAEGRKGTRVARSPHKAQQNAEWKRG